MVISNIIINESKYPIIGSHRNDNSNNIARESLPVGNDPPQSFSMKINIIKSVKNASFTEEEIEFIKSDEIIDDPEGILPKLIPLVQKRFTETAFAFLDKDQTQALDTTIMEGDQFWFKDLKIPYLLPKQIRDLQRFLYVDDLESLSKPQFQALDMQELLEKDPQSADLTQWSRTDRICQSAELLNNLTPGQFKIVEHKVQPELWPDLDPSLIHVLDLSKLDKYTAPKVIKKKFIKKLLPSQIPAIQKFFTAHHNEWCSWLSNPQIRHLNISSLIENNQLRVMTMYGGLANWYENRAFANLEACIDFFQKFHPEQIEEMQDQLPKEILTALDSTWTPWL